MANETRITVVGNLTADPEIRYTQNGLAVANMTIASTPRSFDRQTNEWKDEEALFLRSSVWREAAENVSKSLHKGMRVVATGILKSKSYVDKEGQNRTSLEFDIEEIGPSLRYAIAMVTRANTDGQTQQRQPERGQARTAPPQRPAQAVAPGAPQYGQQSWNDEQTPAYTDDDVPF
jgi:single-strand DNA-binding protein